MAWYHFALLMSQASVGEYVDPHQLIAAADEVAKVLDSAASHTVGSWTAEHVQRGFGWAAWLEAALDGISSDNGGAELDVDLEKLQDGRPGVPSREDICLSYALLQRSRTLLLRTLLRNPATPAAVIVEALKLADTSEVSVTSGAPTKSLSAQTLVPAIRADAELRWLAALGAETPANITAEYSDVNGGASSEHMAIAGLRDPVRVSSAALGMAELLWQSWLSVEDADGGGSRHGRCCEKLGATMDEWSALSTSELTGAQSTGARQHAQALSSAAGPTGVHVAALVICRVCSADRPTSMQHASGVVRACRHGHTCVGVLVPVAAIGSPCAARCATLRMRRLVRH